MDKSARETLQERVEEAQQLLKQRAMYYTDADKEALEVMLRRAELALEGKNEVPFTRNREFYVPREEEQVEYALERYTMVPTYLTKGVWDFYGLSKSLQWFKDRDVSQMSGKDMEDRARYLLQSAEDMLGHTLAGNKVGEYSLAWRSELYESLNHLRRAFDCGSEKLGLAIVRMENAIRNYRDSRVLLSDIESDFNLYLSPDEIEKLKNTIEKDEMLKQQFQQMKDIADRYTLEDIELAYAATQSDSDNYLEFNKRFYIWSYTDKIANFSAPDNAVKANISFVLPSEENETDGLGHVWIDDVDVLSAAGRNMEIENPGFEEGEEIPRGWVPCSLKGTPVMRWEKEYPYCGKEQGSIYIENPTAQDEGAWMHEKVYEVKGGSGYTLTFRAKIDGKFKKGFKTIISFWDESGNPLENYVYYFNRKSYLPPVCFALEMQCDAILYALTGETIYAKKAKTEMLYVTNDFCQGIETWLTQNVRPEGCDAYGAVQGGRILTSLACTYMFIRNAGVFAEEEKNTLYKRISYMLDDMLDLRDRTELSPSEALRGCGNWQTDMCAGTLLFMLAAPDYPEHRKTWLYNAYYILKNQLIESINEDGSWPESIRYHFAALMRFASVARVVKHMMGEDWFVETNLQKMFSYALDMQTPKYDFMDGRISTPPFGDHKLSNGDEFAIYGIYFDIMQSLNKFTADKMYMTWELAGKPVPTFGNEKIAFENLLIKSTTYQVDPGFELYLNSTQSYKNSGIYIFRKDYGSENQSYFAIMSSPKKIAHGHLDQGSFILYKDSVPIVMDSAIEGYFDTSAQWHISSYSHACVLFQSKEVVKQKPVSAMINLSAGDYTKQRGWCDTPDHSKVLECVTDGNIKTITIEIENTEGPGKHIRKVVYMKSDDIYIIYDKIEDFDGDVLFSLPVVSTESVITENRVLSKCHYGMELETTFLSNTKSIKMDCGRTLNIAPEQSSLEYIRAVADASDGFLTILEPRREGSKRGYCCHKKDGYWMVTTDSDEEALIAF